MWSRRRSDIVGIAVLVGLVLVGWGLPASEVSAHDLTAPVNVEGCDSRAAQSPPGVIFVGDSNGKRVFDWGDRGMSWANPDTADGSMFLRDWYESRGWDVCDTSRGAQPVANHVLLTETPWTSPGTSLSDATSELTPENQARLDGGSGFATQFLNPHLGLKDLSDSFHADTVVIRTGVLEWWLVYLVEWYRLWGLCAMTCGAC